MPEVHPSAILDGDVTLADDVVIGPYCVLTGPIEIGAGTRLIGNVYLQGPLRLGERNLVYPFACLGFAPQHAKYDPREPGLGTEIGDDNVFREYTSVHRAFTQDGPTRIGSHGWFMTEAHVGHDSQVGDHVTMASGVMVAGHVTVDERVIIGGNSGVHQFSRVGRGVMVAGGIGVSRDVPPYFMCTEYGHCGSINLVGLRRSGMPSSDVNTVRWVFRTLYRRGMSVKAAVEVLRTRGDEPLVREYIDFIESSQRGISTGGARRTKGRRARIEAGAAGMAPAADDGA